MKTVELIWDDDWEAAEKEREEHVRDAETLSAETLDDFEAWEDFADESELLAQPKVIKALWRVARGADGAQKALSNLLDELLDEWVDAEVVARAFAERIKKIWE